RTWRLRWETWTMPFKDEGWLKDCRQKWENGASAMKANRCKLSRCSLGRLRRQSEQYTVAFGLRQFLKGQSGSPRNNSYMRSQSCELWTLSLGIVLNSASQGLEHTMRYGLS